MISTTTKITRGRLDGTKVTVGMNDFFQKEAGTSSLLIFRTLKKK